MRKIIHFPIIESMKSKKPSQDALLVRNLTKSLLQYIQGKRYNPATCEQLIAQLGVQPIHIERFKKILEDAVANQKISLRGGKYIPYSGATLTTGTISVHPKGFGFVKNELGSDVFIPKQRMGGAVDGDEVEIEIDSNVSAKGPEGTVVAIVKRSRANLAGIVVSQEGDRFLAFSPLLGAEKSIRVSVAKGETLTEGDRIICRVTSWNALGSSIEGSLLQRIGHISDPSIDIKAAIAEFNLLKDFSAEAIQEAQSFGSKVSPNSQKGRLDLTEIECVTIDPDTARDFDDAISLTKDEKGHFRLGVHIADVAYYVQSGTHLDKESFERCNSTYFPGQCVPMLPEELSNELCSLKPKVKRLTQSVLAEFDPQGNLVRYKIVRSVIKSQKRFTYKEALAVLEKQAKSTHAPLLERMVEFCLILKRKRFERGSIDFALTENALIVDKNGTPSHIEKIEYDITHQMIEEFMLKANELVAIHLNAQGKTLIYRIHEEPSAESFKDFYAFARILGFHLPPQPTHRDIQKLFEEAKSSSLLSQLSVSFIRSMRLAAYSADNIGHYGLALEHYCHFTSPIRRYTDLIIQRLLWDEIPEGCNIQQISTKCSEKERLSFRAESSVVVLKKLRLAATYFEQNPNQVYKAVITRVKPFALFFEVSLFNLEGSLHVSEIGRDYYEYDPFRMTFKGSHTGKTFVAGQEIHITLTGVNFILQQAVWALSQEPSTPSARKQKR